MAITTCVCTRQSFAVLKEIAARIPATLLAALVEHTGCAVRCGLCRPYLERMLLTGETEFGVLRTGSRPPGSSAS